MSKITRLIEKTIIDNQTGEVLKEEAEKEVYIEKEPDFVKIYLDDLSYMKNLPKWVNKILYELLKIMNYENEIILNSSIKERISKKLNLKSNKNAVQLINNSISNFVKKGILLQKERGIYIANPKYFGKGAWSDIKRLRLKVTYSEKGKDFEAEIEKESYGFSFSNYEAPTEEEIAELEAEFNR